MEMIKTGPPLNESDLDGFEKTIGYDLPSDYRQFLLKYNGAKPVPDFFQVPGWQYEESYVSQLKGLLKEKDEKKVDLARLNDLLDGRLPKGFIAIGSDPGGNQILLSLAGETKGNVYFFDHENEPDDATDDLEDYPNIFLVANSFTEFLNNLTPDSEK
jgi:hypothetical protein